MKTKLWSATSLAALLTTGVSFGASSVAWLSPPDGSVFPVGSVVAVSGQAAGAGQVGGTGLDLALVLDNSGSMYGGGQAAQKSAAKALVAALPISTSSVGVVEFQSTSSVLLGLTPVATGQPLINGAIDSLTSWGYSTNIGAGISQATSVLTGPGHTAGRTQMMVIISDGANNAGGSPATAANIAVVSGVDALHTVGIPGHSPPTMKDIVDGPDNILGNADDYGIYTNSVSLSGLISLFNGTAGNLVGLQNVSVTLPNGVVIPSVATDGLGNFSVSGWTMQPGANIFRVDATATDNTSATAYLTLNGAQQSVPDGGTTLALLGLSLGAIFCAKKRLAC